MTQFEKIKHRVARRFKYINYLDFIGDHKYPDQLNSLITEVIGRLLNPMNSIDDLEEIKYESCKNLNSYDHYYDFICNHDKPSDVNKFINELSKQCLHVDSQL